MKSQIFPNLTQNNNKKLFLFGRFYGLMRHFHRKQKHIVFQVFRMRGMPDTNVLTKTYIHKQIRDTDYQKFVISLTIAN